MATSQTQLESPPHGVVTSSRPTSFWVRRLHTLQDGWASYMGYYVVVLVVAFLVLVPVAMVLFGSVWSSAPGRAGHLTLGHVKEFLTSPANLVAGRNTLIVSFATAALSTVFGVVLAWLTHRTDIPGRRWISLALSLTYYFPSFIMALAWTFLLAPRSGLLNELVRHVAPNWAGANIYSMGGIVWVMVLSYAPYVYMFCRGPIQAIDPALEEASAMSGSGPLRTSLRVTTPLIGHAVVSGFLLTFVLSAGVFGVPAMLGTPAGVRLLSTEIWANVRFSPTNYGLAATQAVALMMITTVGVVVQRYILRRRSYATITGKGYRPQIVKLGRWRFLASLLAGFYLLLGLVVPLAALAYSSLVRYFVPDPRHASYTLRNYVRVFQSDTLIRAFKNTLILSIGGATIGIILAFTIAYLLIRMKVRGGWVLETLSMIPIGVPGMVFGIGLLWAYVGLPVPIYGTILILLFAYLGHLLPHGLRAIQAQLVQLDDALEEASLVSGAARWYGLVKVVFPLVLPAFLSGWILLLIAIVKEISTGILLYSYGSEVVPIMIYDLQDSGQRGMAAALALMTALFIFGTMFAVMRWADRITIQTGD